VKQRFKIVAGALVLLGMAACSRTPSATRGPFTSPGASGAPSTGPTEKPVGAESNPPGDIPDNQAFVSYRVDAAGFDLRAPEGWARRTTTSTVTFSDKLNAVLVGWKAASAAPTTRSARSNDVPALQRTERAFQLVGVTQVSLPVGAAVLITFRENSAPNDVTGRQYRLDVLRYELYRSGREVDVSLSSPVGADNVDPWRIVSRSFRWV